MKFLLLSDHLSPFFDGWSSDYKQIQSCFDLLIYVHGKQPTSSLGR